MFDAYGALEYLSALSFVASDRVAVMGWSDGAPLSAASVAELTSGTLLGTSVMAQRRPTP